MSKNPGKTADFGQNPQYSTAFYPKIAGFTLAFGCVYCFEANDIQFLRHPMDQAPGLRKDVPVRYSSLISNAEEQEITNSSQTVNPQFDA